MPRPAGRRLAAGPLTSCCSGPARGTRPSTASRRIFVGSQRVWPRILAAPDTGPHPPGLDRGSFDAGPDSGRFGWVWPPGRQRCTDLLVGVPTTSVGTYVAPQPRVVAPRRSRRGLVALIAASIAVLVVGTTSAAQPWRSSTSTPSSGSASPSLAAPGTTAKPLTGRLHHRSVTSPRATTPPTRAATTIRTKPQSYRYDVAAGYGCKPKRKSEVEAVWQTSVARGLPRAGDAMEIGLRSKFGNMPELIKYQEPLAVDVRMYLPDGSSRVAQTLISRSDTTGTVIWPGDFAGADTVHTPGTYTVVWSTIDWTKAAGANRFIACDGFVAQ